MDWIKIEELRIENELSNERKSGYVRCWQKTVQTVPARWRSLRTLVYSNIVRRRKWGVVVVGGQEGGGRKEQMRALALIHLLLLEEEKAKAASSSITRNFQMAAIIRMFYDSAKRIF